MESSSSSPVINPSQDSRFVLIQPEVIGQSTFEFVKQAKSLTATFYSPATIGNSFLQELAGKKDQGNYIVNYGHSRGPEELKRLESKINQLSGTNVSRFSEPTSRTRIHAKTYISENSFLISSQNPSEGFEQFDYSAGSARSFGSRMQVYLSSLVGFRGPKLSQINYAVQSNDPNLRRELLGITEAIQRGESPSSTQHFITGGANSNSSAIIQSYINQAKKGEQIRFASAYMDDPAIVSSLVRAKKRGVDVEGIVNNQENLNQFAVGSSNLIIGALQFLSDSDIPLYAPLKTDPLKQHSKFMVIGDRVISGSHNFTSAANRDSVEISLNVKDADLASQFKKSFERLKEDYKLKPLYKNFNPERQAAPSYNYYERAHVQLDLQKKGINNPGFAHLGTKTIKDDLKVPSVLPSSYFHSRALYNATLTQRGDLANRIRPSEIFKKRDGFYEPGRQYLGILSSQYAMVKLIQDETVPDLIPEVFRQYDRALERGTFGDVLNELSISQGLGRLYKSEIGIIPSFLGSIGRVLDSTIAYYGAEVPDYLLRVNQLNQFQIQEKPAGPFESILTTLSNSVVSSFFSILTYLAVSLPVTIGTSKILESLANRALADVVNKGSQANIGSWAIVGTRKVDKLKDPDFYKNKLNLFSPGYNLIRRPGQIMFDHVIRPIIENVISPFDYSSAEYASLTEALDEYSKALGEPVKPDIEEKVYKNYGFSREQNLAKSFDKIGKILPLNPLNWRWGREGFDIGRNYVKMSDLISLEEATRAVEEAFKPVGKVLRTISEADELFLGERSLWRKSLKAIQEQREILEIDNQLSKALKEIGDIEDALIAKEVLIRESGNISYKQAEAIAEDLQKDVRTYRQKIKNQEKDLRKAIRTIVKKDTSIKNSRISDEIERRLQDFYIRANSKSTGINVSSEIANAALDSRSTINGLPLSMFRKTAGLTALSIMVFSTASAFLLNSQRGVPQLLQIRAQRELDQEEAGITEITATRIFDLPLEVDVTARIAYLSGAVALGHFVNVRKAPFQQDNIVGLVDKKPIRRTRRSRTQPTVVGLGTTLVLISAPIVVEHGLAYLRQFFRFIRGKSSSMPVTSQAQAVASNLTLFSQSALKGGKSAAEIQAAYQAERLASMLSFVYEDRFRESHVIAQQAPTPFFQVFFTLGRLGQRERDGVSEGGTVYPSFGIQAPSALGAGFSVELPFGFTSERDESGAPRGSIFGLVYNPSQDSVTNYLYALTQLSLLFTARNIVVQTGAVLFASPDNFDVRMKQARASAAPFRTVENILSLPLHSASIFKASGLIIKEGSFKAAEMLWNKIPYTIPTPIARRSQGLTLLAASAAASAAAGYLLTETILPEDQVSTQLWGAGVGLTAGTVVGIGIGTNKVSKGTKKQASILALSVLAAAVITDPEFEFMRSEGEELTSDYILERVVTGSIIAGFISAPLIQAHRAVSEEGIDRQMTRVEKNLEKLESRPLTTFRKFEKNYLINRQSDLKTLKSYYDSKSQSKYKVNFGTHYRQNFFKVQLPRALAVGFGLYLMKRSLLQERAAGDWIQNALDTFSAGREVDVEPLLRDSIIAQNLLTRDGLTERVSPLDPQFARSAQRQPILRALSRAYYIDAPNSFMGLAIAPLGLTFRSTPEGIIGTPYAQFQAASIDISFAQMAMPLSRGGALSTAMTNSYDLLFMLQGLSGMSSEEVSYSMLNLTASLPILTKRRTVSRPSELVMSYIAKDPLLTYITQDRIARSASDSYKRPESLYFSMENEAWQTITSSLPLSTIQSMSPSDMKQLIQQLMYAGGVTQTFNLIPNAAGLGRLRYASNQNIEDLLNFSSPYYEDEAAPIENRFIRFISSAWQSSQGGFILPSILMGAVATTTALQVLILLSQTTPTGLSSKVNDRYRDLINRLEGYKERPFPNYADNIYGNQHIFESVPSDQVRALITKLETKNRLFIQEMTSASTSITGKTSLIDHLLGQHSSSGFGLDNLKKLELDKLNEHIQDWFNSRVDDLFDYEMKGIEGDQFDSYRRSSTHAKNKLKKSFEEALDDIRIVKKGRSFWGRQQRYKLGSFLEPSTALNLDTISSILTSTYLEKIEEPLKELRKDLGGYATENLTRYEAVEHIRKVGATEGVSTPSGPIKRIRTPNVPIESSPTNQTFGKDSWWRKTGVVAAPLFTVIGVLDFIGALNLGLRITTAYADDAPEGYINNLIDSFADDALAALIYSSLGGLGVKGVVGMAVVALGYFALDNILGRFEPTEDLTKNISFVAKEMIEKTYRKTVETGSNVPFIEQEDVAFGITVTFGVSSAAGFLSAAGSFAKALNPNLEFPTWVTNPFRETGEMIVNGLSKLIPPGTKSRVGKGLRSMSDPQKANRLAKTLLKGSKGKGKGWVAAAIGAAAILVGSTLIGAAFRGWDSFSSDNSNAVVYRGLLGIFQGLRNYAVGAIPLLGFFMPGAMDYMRQFNPNSAQNPFLVATPEMALKGEYLQMLTSAGQDMGRGTVNYFVSADVYGIPNRYSREAGAVSREFEGMGPKRLLDPLLDHMLLVRGQEFNNRVIGQMNWRAVIRRATNYRQLRKALENPQADHRSYRNNTNALVRRLSDNYDLVLLAIASINRAPEKAPEAVKMAFAEVPKNRAYEEAAIAAEMATQKGQAGTREIRISDLGPGQGFEIDVVPSQSHLIESAATQYLAYQNTMMPVV